MLIRDAQPNDFARLMELYAQLNPDDTKTNNGEDLAAFDEIITTQNLHLFVFEGEQGGLQATCYLNLIPNITRGASPYGIIENVVAEKSLRSRGIGKAIVRYALEFAWTSGCYKVMLQTGSQRKSTHDFYRSCGFSGNDKFAFVARPPKIA